MSFLLFADEVLKENEISLHNLEETSGITTKEIVNNKDEAIESISDSDLSDGTNPKVMLLTAILCGDVKTAEGIVKNRINLNYKDTSGLTPLYYAICFNYTNLAKLMINNGSNINARDLQGYTPLHYAAQIGNEEIFNLLVKRGAKIDVISDDGITLLHFAAYGGNISIINTLLEKKADISIKDNHGLIPLDYAVIFQHKEVITKLTEITPDELIGANSLIPTVLLGDTEILQLIVKKIPDINKFNTEDDSICWVAAANCELDIFKILENSGLDIHFTSNTGKNALHFAAEEGNISVMNYLLGKGFDINSIDSYNGYTPCMYACVNGNVDAFKILAEKKADLNIQNQKGTYLIHEAAFRGNVEVVIFLLGKEVNINLKDSIGLTPLFYACDAGKLGMVMFLLELGADINLIDEKENTVLHYAVLSDNNDIFDLIMKAIPDVNAKNSEGITPLHYAAMLGNMEMVKKLTKSSSRISAMDNEGNNMLHYAVIGGEKAVSFFLTLGLKADSLNNAQETPLSIAEKNGKKNIVNMFRKTLENKTKP